jgi:hypothetical protein
MLTPQQRAIAEGYLNYKASWSKANDHLIWGATRSPVPALAPLGAVDVYKTQYGNPYTGDPLRGVVDFYTNPNRLQAALINGTVNRLYIDCDDVAGWYLTAVRQVAGYSAHLLTLIDSRIVGSHVICVYTGLDGKCGGLDTNGHHDLADLTEATICEHWSALYAGNGYHYIGAVTTEYPFV